MKRLNPNTQEPFKQGDTLDEETYFTHYIYRKKDKEGFFLESWLSKEAFSNRVRSRRVKPNGKFLINPKTGEYYKRYETLPDGRIFNQFRKNSIDENGFYRFDAFSTWEQAYKSTMKKFWFHAKDRSEAKNIPFDITADYLWEIFPKDMICPVLGIEMTFGAEKTGSGTRWNSPSLDRIIPKEGYVEGNLVFMSNRANFIKSNATIGELTMVHDFLLNQVKNRHKD